MSIKPGGCVRFRDRVHLLMFFRPPVCASTCADFATSEETIIMTPDFCGGNTSSLIDLRVNLVRADFTVCSLPANSLRYPTITLDSLNR